jgi:hypothetical protein
MTFCNDIMSILIETFSQTQMGRRQNTQSGILFDLIPLNSKPTYATWRRQETFRCDDVPRNRDVVD